jgi:cytochrome c oxidase subunit 4
MTSGENSNPHVSVRVYLIVFSALLVLTAVTTAVAFLNLGAMNVVIMLAIAVTKATLVVLYFMHVRYSSRLTWAVVSTAFAWLVVMILFTLSDFATRGALGLGPLGR